MLLLASINCFMVPVEIVIPEDEEPTGEGMTISSVANLLIDSIFIIDLLVNFNTTFEEDLEVIYDRKKIARNYLKSRFLIDFISAIPVDVIISFFGKKDAKELKAFSLLKLVRMLRLSRIIRALNV